MLPQKVLQRPFCEALQRCVKKTSACFLRSFQSKSIFLNITFLHPLKTSINLRLLMLSGEKVASGNMDWRFRTSKVQTQIDLIFNKNNMFWLVTNYRYIKCLMNIKSHSRNILTKYSLRIKMILNKLQKDMVNRRLNNEIFGFWDINNYRGETFFLFKLLKYTLLLFGQSVTHKFLCLLYLTLFYSILLLKNVPQLCP